MKIPIRKHTKVRRPQSRWQLFVWEIDSEIGVVRTVFALPPLVVQDISKGLENPLWCEHIFPSDWKMYYNKDNTTYYAPDGDWEELHKEMDNSIDRLFSVLKKTKPSLLTRIKRKVGR